MTKLICVLNLGTELQKIYKINLETSNIEFSEMISINELPNIANGLYRANEIQGLIFLGDTYIVNAIKEFFDQNLEIEVK